jgi:hypothetical protein
MAGREMFFGPFIAFYAYHPAYSVPGTTNPGNCADPANLSNKECETQLQSLKNATQTHQLQLRHQPLTQLHQLLNLHQQYSLQ